MTSENVEKAKANLGNKIAHVKAGAEKAKAELGKKTAAALK